MLDEVTSRMYEDKQQEGITLLHDMKVQDYNQWRRENPTIRLDISRQDFSSKDMSGVYLNDISGTITNLSGCNLSKANLVQSELTEVNLEGANLSDALYMFFYYEEV
jgi:uncharacterized protein YjbI with pentapeptide repeats